MGKLSNKTIFISGGSRGIGLAIAKRAAMDGANIALAAKTIEPHPKLEGTLFTAAKEIEDAGGQALPIVCDIRDEAAVDKAVKACADKFGEIDICINNASAISVTSTLETTMKKFDLMTHVNVRGTFLVSQKCHPYLKKSDNPHIINIAPPLDMSPKWFKDHTAYTIAKYGMSLCTLGMAAEFKTDGIGVNSLWPLTTINTAAVRNELGGQSMANMSRNPEIMADAAYLLMCKDAKNFTGQFVIDEFILSDDGEMDFSKYNQAGYNGPLAADLFVPSDLIRKSRSEIVTLETVK